MADERSGIGIGKPEVRQVRFAMSQDVRVGVHPGRDVGGGEEGSLHIGVGGDFLGGEGQD